MVGEAGIEPAVSRTPSEHSTTEPFPGKIVKKFYSYLYILSFFEQLGKGFFDFRQKFDIRTALFFTVF